MLAHTGGSKIDLSFLIFGVIGAKMIRNIIDAVMDSNIKTRGGE